MNLELINSAITKFAHFPCLHAELKFPFPPLNVLPPSSAVFVESKIVSPEDGGKGRNQRCHGATGRIMGVWRVPSRRRRRRGQQGVCQDHNLVAGPWECFKLSCGEEDNSEKEEEWVGEEVANYYVRKWFSSCYKRMTEGVGTLAAPL